MCVHVSCPIKTGKSAVAALSVSELQASLLLPLGVAEAGWELSGARL